MQATTVAAILLVTTACAIGSTLAFAPTPSQQRTPTSLGFFGGGQKKASASTKSSPFVNEAVQIYLNKYPADQKTVSFFFESWGMPARYQAPKSKQSIFSRNNEELAATFNAIASIYGDEAALKMVKISPTVLSFEKSYFQPSLDAFAETFGYEESKEMVIRNPGLLGSKPQDAKGADDLTMQLSYVVEFTRPIGAFGPASIIVLLFVPALESALGVGKGELLSALF